MERLAWPDGNRSRAFTGRWLGTEMPNLLMREDAPGFVYHVAVLKWKLLSSWQSVVFSHFLVRPFPHPRSEADTKSSVDDAECMPKCNNSPAGLPCRWSPLLVDYCGNETPLLNIHYLLPLQS